MKKIFAALFLCLLAAACASRPVASTTARSILISPVFETRYSCVEHPASEMKELGDLLGTDCIVYKLTTEEGRTWLRAYKDKGAENADWYGWQQNVHAPFDGVVTKIHINPIVNRPGVMAMAPASFISVKNADGVSVLLAHVADVTVKEGEAVKAGQVIAKVGNNGYSRHPHIHLGAFDERGPFQIRFDQTQMHPRD